MDMKALAKSKRAHSLHHSKKHHPNPASKAPSSSSGDKKPVGKQAKEKPTQSHGARPLPSNWDRYNEDLNLGSEDTAQTSSSQPTEFVMPKSKGADYGHLISEATARSPASYSSDVLSLFDDVIYDFTQDFGPMLAAKGRSMLSWIADDNFEFESKASSNFEAPFLSLNLNALAEQLGKAKLSERLFLEPDLLPPELLDDESQACREDNDSQTAVAIDSGTSSVGYKQDGSKNFEQHYEPSSSATKPGNFPVQTSEEGSKPMKQIKDETFQSQGSYRSISPNSVSERILDSISGNSPIFEAVSAEAELDMLLSSFNETKLLESSSAASTGIPSIAAASAETLKQRTDIMKPATTPANVNDAIDDLIEETSHLIKTEGKRPSHMVTSSPDDISSAMNPSSKSKLLDDFDSWLDTI
ncbi:hypothetical protein Salat_0208300 [Sesamum alatum]|uniref:Uncharacterized protein n=1 Tax=Sesamum alatum TaxID=300844 RepID=A0AAE2CY05_9LAMI|nr:hypothetical protein Salat_0208300 [Sesamum alatum]